MSEDNRSLESMIRIIGIGNLLYGDEGVGIEAVRCLRPLLIRRGDIEVYEGGVAGFALIDLLEGIGRVIFIDAVDFGLEDGEIVTFSASDLSGDIHLSGKRSLHEIGIPEILKLAQSAGITLPEISFYGIQVGEIAMGIGLSPRVSRALPRLVKKVLDDLCPQVGGDEKT